MLTFNKLDLDRDQSRGNTFKFQPTKTSFPSEYGMIMSNKTNKYDSGLLKHIFQMLLKKIIQKHYLCVWEGFGLRGFCAIFQGGPPITLKRRAAHRYALILV